MNTIVLWVFYLAKQRLMASIQYFQQYKCHREHAPFEDFLVETSIGENRKSEM